MLQIGNRLTRLISKNVNIKDGYKATSLNGCSTCAVSTNKKEEMKFEIGVEYKLSSKTIIAPSVKGYHYCEFLSEVFLHRPIEGKINKKTMQKEYFEYYKIKANGNSIKARWNSEIVTDKIILTERIENEEMLSILQKEKEIFSQRVCGIKRHKKYYKKMIRVIDESIQYINKI